MQGIMGQPRLSGIKHNRGEIFMDFCDDENRAKWFTRVPVKTIEKLQKKHPDAKVESKWIMTHERSREAYAVKITHKDGAVQYVAGA